MDVILLLAPKMYKWSMIAERYHGFACILATGNWVKARQSNFSHTTQLRLLVTVTFRFRLEG